MAIDSISFRISQSTSNNGINTKATIHGVSGTLTQDDVFQKYMIDVIAHALSNTGLDIENERFTYTFPFHLK